MSQPISKVVIVGASGRIGGAFAEALVKTGKHTVAALVRPDSTGALPSGVHPIKVDYTSESSIVSALQGQQFLIITLSVQARGDLHKTIVQAAAKAGVKWIMPNCYGQDYSGTEVSSIPDVYRSSVVDRINEVKETGIPYVTLVCGFWYEWSLACGEQWYGFDIKNRKVTFYDDGKFKIRSSTWNQCGRAVAALLSLPESGASPSVADWKNSPLLMSSFVVSQRDMLESLHRVLGTKDADWTISSQPTLERFNEGMSELQKGNMTGFAKALYAKGFIPDGVGYYPKVNNDVLGLPVEDLDEATKRAVDMVESGWTPFG